MPFSASIPERIVSNRPFKAVGHGHMVKRSKVSTTAENRETREERGKGKKQTKLPG
jgi:hypothetical protein